MSFEAHAAVRTDGGHETSHTLTGSATGSHRNAVYVRHYPIGDSRGSSHVVIVNNGADTAQLYWPTEAHGANRAYLGAGKYGSPPSPELKALIETHGQHPDQWMPLLDKVAEEYPHMQPAIDAHVAARYSS